MSRIIFINRFFAPDHSATSQILTDLAVHLAGNYAVHVVTSTQIYGDPTQRLPDEEIIDNVHVHRVAATQFSRASLVGRLIVYLSLYWRFWRRLNVLIEPGDVLVAKTDPPLLSLVVAQVARRKRVYFINWLQDLYPEVAVELGVLPKWLARPLGAMRDRSLRMAKMNVVLSERMAEKVAASNVKANAIVTIPNWSNDKAIHPIDHDDNTLRTEWGLNNRFVVGYSGNLGRAHEYQTVLAAAAVLTDRTDILFLMIGGGHGLDKLKAEIRNKQLESKFLFKPYQSREMLANSLAVSDVHWVSLLPSMDGLIVPSKIYGILAAGRPILAITSNQSDVAQLVGQFNCGDSVLPGNGEDLARLIERYAKKPEEVRELGRQARQCLDANFTMDKAFARWHDVFKSIN